MRNVYIYVQVFDMHYHGKYGQSLFILCVGGKLQIVQHGKTTRCHLKEIFTPFGSGIAGESTILVPHSITCNPLLPPWQSWVKIHRHTINPHTSNLIFTNQFTRIRGIISQITNERANCWSQCINKRLIAIHWDINLSWFKESFNTHGITLGGV